jgi:glycosyltransferase involved in cell wall biosynthesis
VIAFLPLLAFVLVAVNVLVWRRPQPLDEPVASSLRVLVPARNEARRILPTLTSILPQAPVTVLDDQSEDLTGEIARRAGATVVNGQALPPGWVGKTWALEQLGQGSDEDLLVFVDADVVLEPGAIAAIARELETADVFTAVPRQATGTRAEELMLPLLHVSYTAWLPLHLVESLASPRFLAANGQILAMRRSVWRGLGGLLDVRDDLVDDMAICRLAKAHGYRVRFADGGSLGTTRMYDSAAAVFAGFSKNLYEGLGSKRALFGVSTLYLAAFVVPYVALFGSALGLVDVWWPALVGVAANVALRLVLAWRHGHPIWSVVAHPVAVLCLVGIALNSWRWSFLSRIEWAGRVYRARAERQT